MNYEVSSSCINWFPTDGSFDGEITRRQNLQAAAEGFVREMESFDFPNIEAVFLSFDSIVVTSFDGVKRAFSCSGFGDALRLVERACVLFARCAPDAGRYENLSNYVASIVGGSVYATSYGVGIDALVRGLDNKISTICAALDAAGIEYTNEYSAARWVYRFRIHRSASNMERLRTLCK